MEMISTLRSSPNDSSSPAETCYRTFPPLTLAKQTTQDGDPQPTLATAPFVSIPLEIVVAKDFSRILVLYVGGTIGMKKLNKGGMLISHCHCGHHTDASQVGLLGPDSK